MFKVGRTRLGVVDVFGEVVVRDSKPDFRLSDHVDEFALAQHRHCCDCNAAGFQNGQP
jgi:hypothetical protein